MGKVTKLHTTGVDDVLEAIRSDDCTEIMVVAKTRGGQWVTYDNRECTLETMALGAQLMQAQVMRDCGRLLGPDDID